MHLEADAPRTHGEHSTSPCSAAGAAGVHDDGLCSHVKEQKELWIRGPHQSSNDGASSHVRPKTEQWCCYLVPCIQVAV